MCRRGQRAIAGREQPSYAPGLMSVLLRCILGVWALEPGVRARCKPGAAGAASPRICCHQGPQQCLQHRPGPEAPSLTLLVAADWERWTPVVWCLPIPSVTYIAQEAWRGSQGTPWSHYWPLALFPQCRVDCVCPNRSGFHLH